MSRDEKRARELLPLLADGELLEHEEALVRRMMERNPSLKQEGEDYIVLKRLTSDMPRAAAPENIEGAVISRLSEKRGVLPSLTSFFTPPRRVPLEALGVAAACVLVIFAVIRLVPILPMKSTEESVVVESVEPANKGRVESPTLTVGEDDAPAVLDAVPHTSADTTPSRSAEKSLPLFTDNDLIAEEESIMVEPEDEIIAGVTPPLPAEGHMDSVDATVPGSSPPAMPDTAPAAMTAGDTVKRGASATILLVSTSRGTEQPIILTIYTKNPYETERTIMNKVMELGGDVTRMRYDVSGDTYLKDKKEASEYIEGNLPPMVYLPPESMEDLLTFIESRYPPIGPDLEELDMTEKEELLQLDFTAPDGEN
ncbi:MAG: hypothetical protein JW885_04090 [Deltaproteobacteria bacterium]|nr:hypothetical protein [Candidatus Zymogenaceae bacterium]